MIAIHNLINKNIVYYLYKFSQPNHSNSVQVRNSQPVAFLNYQAPMMSQKYCGQYIYHNPSQYQLNSSQLSTPKKIPPEVPKRTSSISFKSNDSNQSLLSNLEVSFGQIKYGGSLSSVQSSSSDSSSTVNASHSSLNMSNCLSSSTSWNKKPQVCLSLQIYSFMKSINLKYSICKYVICRSQKLLENVSTELD